MPKNLFKAWIIFKKLFDEYVFKIAIVNSLPSKPIGSTTL